MKTFAMEMFDFENEADWDLPCEEKAELDTSQVERHRQSKDREVLRANRRTTPMKSTNRSSKWKGVKHQYGVKHLKTADDPIEGFETMVRDFDLNSCACKS